MTDSNCSTTKLSDRGVLRVSGVDAKAFLQGIVTNDVELVTADTAVHAGLLTPQGKILFDFFVVGDGHHYLLECPRTAISELAKRLTFYKLRAQVDLDDASDAHAVAAIWGGAPEIARPAIAYRDPRLGELGLRVILPAAGDLAALGCREVGEADYHAHRIGLGVPEGTKDFDYGDAFPHEADFDQLNGVDFDKGCYVGQEVVSRMQHRGTARKRIVPVEGERALPAPGAQISAAGTPIGQLGSVSEHRGLALVRLDRAQKAKREGAVISAGDVAIEVRQPDWADFSVAEKAGGP